MRAGCIAVVLMPALALLAHAEVANRIVATIDGEPVTAHELRQYRTTHGGEDMPDAELLDALITERLLDKEIKAQGISARDEDIDRYVKQVQTRNGLDDATFQRALAEKGLTLDAYRTKVKAELERAQLVNREIRQRVNVSPEEVRRYYEAHLTNYATGERVTVRDILFRIDGDDEAAVARVRAKAEEVRALALDGRDFATLARQFSEGPGADKGGELGSFARGEMESALDEVVFAMKPGEVSAPVRTDAGFHLLRVDTRAGEAHRPLEEVSEEIREALYNEALEERFKSWLSRDLRERHHVEVLN